MDVLKNCAVKQQAVEKTHSSLWPVVIGSGWLTQELGRGVSEVEALSSTGSRCRLLDATLIQLFWVPGCNPALEVILCSGRSN